MNKALFVELLNRATPEAFKEAMAVYKEMLQELDKCKGIAPDAADALLPVLLIEYGRITKKD